MENKSEITKKNRNRSAAYPSSSLAEAVEHLKLIHTDLGKGPYDRGSAAKSIGYNGVSGASASKIAALVHYGLIQRMGSGYMETELGTSIALSFDHEEERQALLEAFKSPTLFAQLLTDFGGKALPAKLEIILVRQYRITEQASKDAAKAFRESAEFVGVLKNGFLIEGDNPSGATENTTNLSSSINVTTAPIGHPSPLPQPSTGEVAIEIGPGVKVVFSSDHMLDVATGKFSNGIGELAKDLEALKPQQPTTARAGNDEEVQS